MKMVDTQVRFALAQREPPVADTVTPSTSYTHPKEAGWAKAVRGFNQRNYILDEDMEKCKNMENCNHELW